MISTVRRALTLFIVIGCWFRVDWTVALLMTWFSIAVEAYGSALMQHGTRIADLTTKCELLREEVDAKRRRSA